MNNQTMMSKSLAVGDEREKEQKSSRSKEFLRKVSRDKMLLWMLSPAVIWYLVFQYYTMYGVILAFKEYKFSEGILGSPWVGFKYFERLFTNEQFFVLLKNTLIVSGLKLLFVFPASILLALLFNEIRVKWFKQTVQSMICLPHFISWVVLAGLVKIILSPTDGIVNYLFGLVGLGPYHFMMEPGMFRWILVLSDIWKSVGWESIVYLAAIAGIDKQLYEAARIDGASRFRQAISITLPCIAPIIVIMFILQVGHIMDAGFGQILNLYNPTVYSVADIFDTYAYRVGLIDYNFSYSTAISLFKNVVGLILLIAAHLFTKRVSGHGIW